MLQPQLLKSSSHGSASVSQSSSQVVVVVADDRDDCDLLDSDCCLGNFRGGNKGFKSEKEAAEKKPAAIAKAVASSAMTAQQ